MSVVCSFSLNKKRGGSDFGNEICGESRKSKEKMRLEKKLLEGL